jgi:uncharacterized phage protein (TIGR01671 family)
MNMKEYLSRGKRIDTGEWAYGYYVQADEKHYIFTGKTGLSLVTPAHRLMYRYFEKHEVIPETVGQYAGFEDSKGRRIFEGDIVRIDYDFPYDKYKLGVVYCSFGSFEVLRRGDLDPENLYNVLEAGVEIIGNIDENPEILMCCLKTLKELNAGSGEQNHEAPELLEGNQ